MLKLILIFKSVLWPQVFLVRRTHFLQLKQHFTYFLTIIQWKTGCNKYIFRKRSYVRATWSYYINPVQQKIHIPWVDNVEFIHCKKLDIKDEDLLLMILELYTSLASCFAIKIITKNMVLLQFCIYFGFSDLLNQKKVIPISY